MKATQYTYNYITISTYVHGCKFYIIIWLISTHLHCCISQGCPFCKKFAWVMSFCRPPLSPCNIPKLYPSPPEILHGLLGATPSSGCWHSCYHSGQWLQPQHVSKRNNPNWSNLTRLACSLTKDESTSSCRANRNTSTLQWPSWGQSQKAEANIATSAHNNFIRFSIQDLAAKIKTWKNDKNEQKNENYSIGLHRQASSPEPAQGSPFQAV